MSNNKKDVEMKDATAVEKAGTKEEKKEEPYDPFFGNLNHCSKHHMFRV